MLHIIATADPFLGKFDQLSLSDQTSMELLVQCFDKAVQNRYQDEEGNFRDISEWNIAKCNDKGAVTVLNLPGPDESGEGFSDDEEYYYESEDDYARHATLAGSFETKYVPRQLIKLDIQTCSLFGTFDVNALPASIENLTVEDVRLMDGPFDFGNLPERSECVRVINSGFSGSVDLTGLPQGLVYLVVTRNRFSGEVDLTKLPPKLKHLNLARSSLSGPINVTKLSSAMEAVILSNNAFVGSLDLSALPEGISGLNVGDNQLSGTLDVSALPKGMKELHLYQNAFSGVLDLNQVPKTLSVRLKLQFSMFRRKTLLSNEDLTVIEREEA